MFIRILFLCLHLLVASQTIGKPFDPIAIYLTWQHNPSTTMTIQWLSDLKSEEDLVEYKAIGDLEWQKKEGIHSQMPLETPYMIHRVELIDLKPGTEYCFKPGHDAVVYQFRTMPTTLEMPVRFVAGGDIYHDSLDVLETMNKVAAKTDPHFALLGGDIAYSTGLEGYEHKENMTRWMEWLQAWKRTMVTPKGFLIPIIPVLGNHDVVGGYSKTAREALAFNTLFPMPGPSGYNVLDMGNYLSIFMLNSGHVGFIAGAQTAWLEQALSSRQFVPNKFALYHVGAYPSFRDCNREICQVIRKNWVPLFEQYGLNTAFENHDHTYKRTYPIRKNKVDPTGVVYLGDGAWGVEDPRTPKTPKELWYLIKSAKIRNILLVTVGMNSCTYQALNSKGIVFDSWKAETFERMKAEK